MVDDRPWPVWHAVDGERLYVEHDVYHNGQLVHRKYRRTVTEPVARALLDVINRAKQ